MNVVWLSLGLFFLFMILGVPIAMSIGLAAGASLLAMDTSLVVMAQKMFISTNSFTLIAIPFFMLVGAIMDRSGITEMLVNFARPASAGSATAWCMSRSSPASSWAAFPALPRQTPPRSAAS